MHTQKYGNAARVSAQKRCAGVLTARFLHGFLPACCTNFAWILAVHDFCVDFCQRWCMIFASTACTIFASAVCTIFATTACTIFVSAGARFLPALNRAPALVQHCVHDFCLRCVHDFCVDFSAVKLSNVYRDRIQTKTNPVRSKKKSCKITT